MTTHHLHRTESDADERCRHLAVSFEAVCMDCGQMLDAPLSTLPVYDKPPLPGIDS